MDTVFEFIYCDNTWESASQTISLHWTRKGAELAMEFHKEECRKEYEERCKRLSSFRDYPFDNDKFWDVIETKVLE